MGKIDGSPSVSEEHAVRRQMPSFHSLAFVENGHLRQYL
jgi:hypothetical protein